MYLENVVFDATEPQRIGRLWESVISGERLTDEVAGFETRLEIPDGPVLDLCFQRVPEQPAGPTRLHVAIAAAPGSGPITALRLQSQDPQRDAAFWSWLTGWQSSDPSTTTALRHPSGLGPTLELCPETAPKTDVKNPVHLDVRLEDGEQFDLVAAGIAERGGRELPPLAAGLPWRLFADPSGNEFCVLPVRR